MSNIIFSINAVAPLLVLMWLGYYCKYKKMLATQTITQCNGLVFKIFLPTLLFNNIRGGSILIAGSESLLLFVFVGILLSFLLALIVSLVFEKDNKKIGVMVQGIARSNYALFGIPLMTLLVPNEDLSIGSLLILLVIPMFNVFSVIALNYFCANKTDFNSIWKGIVTNPLIIATCLGLMVSGLSIDIAEAADKSLLYVGNMATPFSLFLLGAGFEMKNIGNRLNDIIISTTCRLIIIPVIALSCAVAFGFSGVELACIMAVFLSPTAVSSYSMAEAMGGDGHLAASIVVFTSIGCIVTIFIAILVLKSMQLF